MGWRGLGLKRKAKMLHESWVAGAPHVGTTKMLHELWAAGATNTCNVTATVNGKLVLSWHGTPTQKEDALKMLPVVQEKLMPAVSPEEFADATIASIHDGGMASADSIQTLAMLWRLFTTPVDRDLPGVTYGDLIATKNLHAAFELHEQPNDRFKVTWKVSAMQQHAMSMSRGKENRSNTMAARLGNVLFWTGILIAGAWLWFAAEIGLLKNPSEGQSPVVAYGGAGVVVLIGWALRYILRG